jgi:hypothetical protein
MNKVFLTSVTALFLVTGTAHARKEGCIQTLAPSPTNPLTSKQLRAYKELRSIGITKKDAARVVRDPGVKKGEWGWVRAGSASEGVMCVKNEEGALKEIYVHPEEIMKYRNNVVVE